MQRIRGGQTASKTTKQKRGKGCLVLAEAAIPSSGGQVRLKEAEETKRESRG